MFFLVADVSGKGVPAALFMARAKTLFEAAATRQREPAALLAEVNQRPVPREPGGHVRDGGLRRARARDGRAVASPAPAIRRRSGCGAAAAPSPLVTEGATVLGLIDGAVFPQTRVGLSPGDAIFAFTDGVDEAFDAEGALFGTPRLLDCLAALSAAPAEEITTRVRAAVRSFAGAARQSDDITVLALRYLGPPPG